MNTLNKQAKNRINYNPLKVVLPYFVFGITYIIFSDSFLELFTKDADKLTHLQSYKGIAYVIITSFLLYSLIRKNTYQLEKNHTKELERESIYTKPL